MTDEATTNTGADATTTPAIEGKRIVFVHVPKTAGKGLLNQLKRVMGIGPGGLNRLHAKANGRSCLADIALYRAVGGHIDWYDLETIDVPVVSFSVLRDGRERLASMYFFARQNADVVNEGGLRDNRRHRAMRSLDVDAFFSRTDQDSDIEFAQRYDNLQAYYFATRRHRGRLEAIRDIPRDEVVPRALENARRLDLVTTMDRLYEVEELLAREVGLHLDIAGHRANEGPVPRGESRWAALMDEVKSEAVRERLHRFTELDTAFLSALFPPGR
jgi:hypothetical protein